MIKNRFKLNKEFLKELLMTETPYGDEDIVAEVIKQELDKLGFTYFQDKVGNIVAQRGKAKKYPLLNAHMDIVDLSYWGGGYGGKSTTLNGGSYWDRVDEVEYLLDNLGPELVGECVSCKDCIMYKNCIGLEEDMEDGLLLDEEVLRICDEYYPTLKGEDTIYAWAESNGFLEYGFDEEYPLEYQDTSTYKLVEEKGKISGIGRQRVLGGDDKCGIFLALEVARATTIPMKLLFTVGEEVGCVGMKHFVAHHAKWFNNVSYSITIDRKGADNLLSSQLGVRSCTRRFEADLARAAIMENIPVKVMGGSVADVIYIRELVKDAVNISAGYYNAHSEDEYVVWDEVEAIFRWVKRFVESK